LILKKLGGDMKSDIARLDPVFPLVSELIQIILCVVQDILSQKLLWYKIWDRVFF